jgi:hypothetical protein
LDGRGDRRAKLAANRPQPWELAQFAHHRREVFLRSAAFAVFIRRIQVGDDVPLTQILW